MIIWIEVTMAILVLAVGSRSVVAINFCDSSSDSDPRSRHIATKSTAIGGKCYIHIKPESIEPYNICQLSRYAVDIDLGRKVCNNFEATLPMIKSKAENDAIRAMMTDNWNEQVVLLGMKKWDKPDNQDMFRVQWDDGSTDTFSPNDQTHGGWVNFDQKVFTWLYIYNGGWYSYDKTTLTNFVPLVCQQNFDSPVVRTEDLYLPMQHQPYIIPPIPRSSDFCDPTNVPNDTWRPTISAAFHSYSGGRIEKCFFSFKINWTIVECHGRANPTTRLVMGEAQRICAQYSASVPMIKNIDQWNTVGALSSFGLRKRRTYIPLGVQELSYAEKRIVWSDGTVHKFDGDHPFNGEVEWVEPNAGPLLLMWWNGYVSTIYSRAADKVDEEFDLICEQDQSHRVSPPPMTEPVPLPDIDFCSTDERIMTDPRRKLRKLSMAHPINATHKCYTVMEPGIVQSYYITCPIKNSYKIHADAAWQICESFGGTLPIVKDLEEVAVVARMGASIGGKLLLLGVQNIEESNGQINITWDDGTEDQLSNPIFENFTWTKSVPGVITVQKLLPCDNCLEVESIAWDKWETMNEYGPLPSLVCEQDFTKPDRNQSPSLPLFMREIPYVDEATDFCNLSQAMLDPRNEFIQNRLYYPDPTKVPVGTTPRKCFFNFRISWNVGLCHDTDGLKFTIDMNRTRKICNKFSATLPMIHGHEENKYLVALGKAKAGLKDFFHVPLGMQKWERDSASQMTKIFWDDGTAHSFPSNDPFENQTRWHRSDTETQNVTLLGSEGEWRSRLSNMLVRPIVIICEQDLGKPLMTVPPTTVSPPTTASTTTTASLTTSAPTSSPTTSPPTTPSTTITTPNSAIISFESAAVRCWFMEITSSVIIFGQIY